jgi:transposase
MLWPGPRWWIDSSLTSCGSPSSRCSHRHRPVPRRRPTPGPGPQLCGRAHLHGPHPHAWSLLAVKELGCGSATTCWRRLDEWAKAGVLDQLQALDELGTAGRIDLEGVRVDGFGLRAVNGGT